MSISSTSTVGEVASKLPESTRIFAKYGIDFCCGGGLPLAEACRLSGVKVDDLIRELQQTDAGGSEPDAATDFSQMGLRALIDHIVGTHHVYTQYELARISRLMEKVVSVHGERHSELAAAKNLFRSLNDDLSSHLMKEETILFPYIRELDAAAERHVPCNPPMFGTVQNPVRMMRMEHDTTADLLRRLREVTSNYAVPADACASYQALYAAMERFEKDLHQHIHLENNILFPRAIEMESVAA